MIPAKLRLSACAVVLFTVAAIAGCEPWFISKTPVEITGEFRSDGSCNAMIGGVPLFSAADQPRTDYVAGGIEMELGSTVHQINCIPTPHPDWKRTVGMTFVLPDSARAPIGKYTIVDGRGPLTSAPMTLEAAFVDPRYDPGTPGSGTADAGTVYLESISGEAKFSRMDSPKDGSKVIRTDTAIVVGTYVGKAVRTWGMN
jgi:hypothetical protein